VASLTMLAKYFTRIRARDNPTHGGARDSRGPEQHLVDLDDSAALRTCGESMVHVVS